MADFIGSARTNVFRVKSAEDFIKAVGEITSDIVVEQRRNIDDRYDYVMMYSVSEYGTWPDFKFDEDTGDDELIDWPPVIAPHLMDGETCIIMESGAEKLRYVGGWACAIHSDGRSVSVSLNDIYGLAAKEFNVPKESISDCSY